MTEIIGGVLGVILGMIFIKSISPGGRIWNWLVSHREW